MHLKSFKLVLFFFSSILFAQISGTVTDSVSGKPIENVNITNGVIGTTTNSSGNFLINVPTDTELEFSHIAYKSKLMITKEVISVKLVATVIESDHITVRSGLSDKSLQNSVTSVHIITDEEIHDSGSDHFQTLTDQIPNVNWSGGTSRPRYFQIRGVGERSHYFG